MPLSHLISSLTSQILISSPPSHSLNPSPSTLPLIYCNLPPTKFSLDFAAFCCVVICGVALVAHPRRVPPSRVWFFHLLRFRSALLHALHRQTRQPVMITSAFFLPRAAHMRVSLLMWDSWDSWVFRLVDEQLVLTARIITCALSPALRFAFTAHCSCSHIMLVGYLLFAHRHGIIAYFLYQAPPIFCLLCSNLRLARGILLYSLRAFVPYP